MSKTFPFSAKDGRGGLVRVADQADARASLEATREAATEHPRTILTVESELWVPREWRRHRMDWGPDGVTLVAELDGELVGTLSCHRERRARLRHAAEFGLTVARRARGVGVGRALLTAAEAWAREHRVERMQLSVFPHNEQAIALYHALGYEIEGTARRAVRFADEDLDLILMAKWLGR